MRFRTGAWIPRFWDVPAGHWTLLRMGHTSTGHRNDTGGGGKGLEADKFNPEAVRLQFTIATDQ